MLINKKIINDNWKKFILNKDIRKEIKIIDDNAYNNNQFNNIISTDPEIIKYIIIYSDTIDINFINSVLKYIYYNSNNKKDMYTIRKYIDNNKLHNIDYNTILESLKQNGILFFNYSLLNEKINNKIIKYIDNNYNINWLIYSNLFDDNIIVKKKNKRI